MLFGPNEGGGVANNKHTIYCQSKRSLYFFHDDERLHKQTDYVSFAVIFLSVLYPSAGSLLRPIHTQHAVPMPFPCHAVPVRVQNVSFPFDLHSAAVSDSHYPCRVHAIHDHAVLLKATAQHVRRETACGLPARVQLLPATTRGYTKVVIRHLPISDAGGQCETNHRLSRTNKRVVAANCKKDDLLHCWTSSSDISGYHADIH